MMDKQNKKEAYVNEFPEPLGFCPKNLPFARKNGCPSVGAVSPQPPGSYAYGHTDLL